MITICFIGDRNVYLKRICNYLADQNFKIHLICRNNSGIDISEFDQRIEFHTLKSNRLIHKMYDVNSILNKTKPQYLHYQYITKDVLLSLFVFRKYKIILTPWGSDINIFSRKIINRLILNIGFILCEKIQILSEGINNTLLDNFVFINKRKLVDLSWGIDYDRFHTIKPERSNFWKKKLDLKENSIVILSYRNHKPIYNHHTIIKSLPKVKKKFPDIVCIFTRGSYDNEYFFRSKELVKELQLESNVFFVEEWISDEMLPSLLHITDIAVSIPSFDGLPATLLEIMSTKAIPIIGNLDVYSFFFKDMENGFVIEDMLDHEEMAVRLTELIKNIHIYKEMFITRNNDYVKLNQDWNFLKYDLLKLYMINT